MHKGRIPLVIFCVICMAGLLGLQVYWIQKYYKVTQVNFEKEINLAFEDAVKKEFSLRCDTVEQLMIKLMMDTNEFVITSKLVNGKYNYTTRSKENLKDKFTGSIAISSLNIPVITGGTVNKNKIIASIAKNIRETDLETNVVFFRTQNLGRYLSSQMSKYGFDTLRLKPVFDSLLKERNINVPYVLRMIKKKGTISKINIPAHVAENFPVITQTLTTQRSVQKADYVAALFQDPFSYMVSNMAVIFISSILLVLLMAFCLIYLLRSLFKEKRLSAVKNDFISNITHEFKTPIATVSAAVEALTSFDVLSDAEKTQRYLGHAKTELVRLSALVDQVLNIAIYSGTNTGFSKETIDIREVIYSLIESHSVSQIKNIRFHYEHKDLQFKVLADKVQFYHSLNNVIDNAIKYSGEEVDINIRTVVKNNFLLICITDAGFGLSAADLPLVFDQFYRSQNAITKQIKGYGLGLNYVKSIMENHNGWYKMESKPGKGSAVTLAWPI